MMSNKMKVFAVEIIASKKGACLTSGVKHITEGNFLQEAYNIIGCNLVDCRSFEYKDTIYDVWFDDEFLLKSGPIYPTLILGDLKPNFFDLICGNFIIAKSNEDGETIGISTDEANMLILFMHENLHKLRKAIQMGLIGNKKTA